MSQYDAYELINVRTIDNTVSLPCTTTSSLNAVSLEDLDKSADDTIPLVIKKTPSNETTKRPSRNQIGSIAHSKEENPYQNERSFPQFIDKILGTIGNVVLLASAVGHDHNPFSLAGRKRLKDGILRSGPAYQLPNPIVQNQNAQKKRYTGWRMGAFLNMLLLIFCLVIEIIMIIVAVTADKRASDSSLDGVLYSGDCQTAKRWTSGVSLLINVIGTLMIGSSNYMMQCLSAPSGPELREAHKKGYCLQVGVSWPLNAVHTSRMKTKLWWLMAITSVPVHLLLNSAFFASLQTNNYAIGIFAADFQNSTLWDACHTDHSSNAEASSWYSLACDLYLNTTSGNLYEKLERDACIRRYSDPLISQFSNVILVSSQDHSLLNQSQRFVWSHEMPIEESILNFTSEYPWDGSNPSNSGDTAIDPQLADLDALFGVFTAFDYSSWSHEYRKQLNETIAQRATPRFDPTGWLCHDNYTSPCSGDVALENSSDWRVSPSGVQIDYCLSEKTPQEMCQLKYSGIILGVVIGCDALKILVVVLSLRITENPLVTIGDVMAHFLQNPEAFTEKRCLVDRKRAVFETDDMCWSELLFPVYSSPVIGDGTIAKIYPHLYGPLPSRWEIGQMRWLHVISRKGWAALFGMISFVFVAGALLLVLGISEIRSSAGGVGIWSRGLLSADPNALFQSTSVSGTVSSDAFMSQVLLVNTPQLLFSFLYFWYNGIFTTMHAAEEWSGFATDRKPLRVSEPAPGQRSTYWLSLPWSYSLPLIALSALLHWLVSRSLYLVSINVLGPTGELLPDRTISACGFSVLMMICVMVVIALLVVNIVVFSLRRLKGDIPVLGTMSVAISAVCHHPNDPATEACKPLLWGVTRRPGEDGEPGHCALSSGEVERPVAGQVYW